MVNVNVTIYSSTMDPMGYLVMGVFLKWYPQSWIVRLAIYG